MIHMKRALWLVIFIWGCFLLHAREGAKWSEYTGRYVVALKNHTGEVEVAFQDEGRLVVSSPIGRIILVHVEKDCFSIPQYGGTVVFERDDRQEVTACTLSVPIADIKNIKVFKQ
jgi:hypothetical protein